MVGEVVIPLFPPLLNDPQHSITFLYFILGSGFTSTIDNKSQGVDIYWFSCYVFFPLLLFFPH